MTPSYSGTVRRTLVAAVVLGILLLGFSVLNPSSTATTAVSVTQLVLLAILAAGILPGSYIQRLAESLAKQSEFRRRPLFVLLATIGPFLIVIVFAFGIYNAVDTLQFIGQFNGQTFDASRPRYDLLRYSVLGLVSLALLISNLVSLMRMNSQRNSMTDRPIAS